MALTTTQSLGRAPSQLFGGWEAGLLVLLVLLYLGGAFVNPAFFGSTEAFQALLRDTSRVGIIAVGMTFVIVNKDLDLSVGSTYGLVAVVFARLFAPSFLDLGIVPSVVLCLLLGALIGLINGVLVTVLKVPAFIATLTMLFIGRGFVLALTHGQSIYYPAKAVEYPLFFHLGETNAFGFNNQIMIFAIVARDRRLRARQDPLGLRDLRHRRQRAGRDLRRHPDELGAHPRLPDLLALRRARRPAVGGPGQGRDAALRRQRRADRHRRGDHRRRLDPRRPRPGVRLLPRRHARRAARQGAARGLADHPHDQDRRRGDHGQRGVLAAGRARCRFSSGCSSSSRC